MQTIKIALRYLKQQKLHTTLTIISIILSVTLICLLGIFSTSLLKSSAKYAELQYGTYEADVSTNSEKQVEEVKNCDLLEKAVPEKRVYVNLTKSDLDSRICTLGFSNGDEIMNYHFGAYIYDEELISVLSKEYNICLTSGRLPEKDGEIAISKLEYSDYAKNLRVGDNLTLTTTEVSLKPEYESGLDYEDFNSDNLINEYTNFFNEGKKVSKTFKIVGITEAASWLTENDAVALFSEKDLYSQSSVYVQFKNKYNEYDFENYLNNNTSIKGSEENVYYNQEVMSAKFKGIYGKATLAVYFFAFFILILFVLFCARMVIDHSFEIITNERISQFGTLASIGASKKQIKGILFFQALFMNLVAVPIGVAFSIFGSCWFMNIVNSFDFSRIFNISYSTSNTGITNLFDSITLYINIPVFLLCILLSSYGVFVSAFTSAKKAMKLSPIEAMRSSANYKKDKRASKRKRKPKKGLLGRIFGFTGLLASRNIHRNNKRFASTIFSIALSISLVITFGSLMNIIKQGKNYFEENFYDYEIQFNSEPNVSLDEVLKDLNSYGTFKDFFGYNYSLLGKLEPSEKDKLSDKYLERTKDLNFTGMVMVSGFDRNSYEKYIQPSSKVTYDELNQSKGILIPDTARFVSEDVLGSKSSVTELKAWKIKAGNSLKTKPIEKFFTNDPSTLTVSGFYSPTNSLFKRYCADFGNNVESESCGYLNVFTTIENLESWRLKAGTEVSNDNSTTMNNNYYISANSAGDSAATTESLNRFAEKYPTVYIDDIATVSQLLRASVKLFNFAGYTFILIIAGISILNVMNTIITSILSRRKELAMLRACGMSKGRIYRMILGECIMYDLFGYIIGSVIALFICKMFTIAMLSGSLVFDIYPTTFILSAIILVILTVLIAILSLNRVIKGSIIENIKGIE